MVIFHPYPDEGPICCLTFRVDLDGSPDRRFVRESASPCHIGQVSFVILMTKRNEEM